MYIIIIFEKFFGYTGAYVFNVAYVYVLLNCILAWKMWDRWDFLKGGQASQRKTRPLTER